MAVPTTRFRDIDPTLTTLQLDTAAERKTQAGSGSPVDDSGANPWDFGLISIAGASSNQDSAVKHLFWDVTDYGAGNSEVSNFRLWFPQTTPFVGWGFDQVGTSLKFAALRYETGPNGQAYVASANQASYTYSDLPVQDSAPTQNLYAGDGQVNFTNADDDVVGFEAYMSVDPNETTGTYQGVGTAGYEFRMSFRYDYN